MVNLKTTVLAQSHFTMAAHCAGVLSDTPSITNFAPPITASRSKFLCVDTVSSLETFLSQVWPMDGTLQEKKIKLRYSILYSAGLIFSSSNIDLNNEMRFPYSNTWQQFPITKRSCHPPLIQIVSR